MIEVLYKVDVTESVPSLKFEVWEDGSLISTSEANLEEQVNNINDSVLTEYNNSLLSCYDVTLKKLINEIGNRKLLDDSFVILQLVNRKKFVLDYALSRKDTNV